MSMNFDKDLLIKQRFWILLGAGVLLLLIAMIMLPTSVGSTVEAKVKEYDTSVKTLGGISSPKNQTWVEGYEKQDKFVDSKKNVVWEQAWKTQADVPTWPPELQDKFSKLYPYFGDKIDPIDRDEFSKQYDSQLYDVVSLVQPVTPLGTGVVQFNGSWDSVLGLTHQFQTNPPSNDEIWFVQEDLWVKRELLRIIRDTNDMVARFQEVRPEPPAAKEAAKDKKDANAPPPPAEPAKQADEKGEQTKPAQPPKPPTPPVVETPSDPFHKKFRNPYWELDLTLKRSDNGAYSIKGKIKNIGKRKQPLGVVFKVYLDDLNADDTPFVLLPVDRLPLAAGESADFKEQVVDSSITVRALYGVEQILTWKTGPVKRIDALALGYPSSRTTNRTLKPTKAVAEARKKEAEATAAPSGADGAGAPPEVGKKEMMMNMMGGRGSAGAAAGPDLNLDRYTDVNDQVRHMPVGIAVVMEEARIPDLIGAISNSKLRIQVLQCHFDHTRDRIRPNIEEPEESGDKTKPPESTRPAYSMPLPGFGGPGGMKVGSGPGGFANRKFNRGDEGMGGQVQQMQTGMAAAMRQSMMGRGQVANQGMKNIGMNLTKAMGPEGMGSGRSAGFAKAVTGLGQGFGNMFALPSADEDEEGEMNLVEVAVYGLGSLYERYPPKPPPSGDATTPAPGS